MVRGGRCLGKHGSGLSRRGADATLSLMSAATLRVVTFNTWGAEPPLVPRLIAAADGLRSLAPDLIALQEVRAGPDLRNTAEQLAERLGGYEVSYRVATPDDDGEEEGLALLSRDPLADLRVRELPDARPRSRRIVLSARLPAAAPLWVHTTHLHWRLEDEGARVRQTAAITDWVDELGGAHILCGDFNATPEAPSVRHVVEQGGFVDAGAGTGDTWSERNPGTLPLRWLGANRRIDYVFVRSSDDLALGVDAAQVVLDRRGAGGHFPSDHFAVWAELSVARPG